MAAVPREQYHGLIYCCPKDQLKVTYAKGIPKGTKFEIFVPGDPRAISAQRDPDQVCIICDPLIVFENGSDSRAMIADCEDEQDQDTPNNLDFTPILTNDGYVIVPYRVHFTAFEKIAEIDSDGKLGTLLTDSKFKNPD